MGLACVVLCNEGNPPGFRVTSINTKVENLEPEYCELWCGLPTGESRPQLLRLAPV